MGFNISDLETWNDVIEKTAKNMGLNYYTQEFEVVGYSEMIGYESYVGMPSRYPHWSFGKAYEKNKTLYSFNLTGLPYEMVINSNPCLAYLMKDNTLLLQILTMAHVYGHNDFFKNNRLFKIGTNAKKTLEMFKLDADIIRGYINDPSIGYEKVERVLDAAHSIRYQTKRVVGIKEISDDEIKKQRIEDYNKKREEKGILDSDEIKEPELSKIPLEPDDDVINFIIEHGKLCEWEKNILRIVKRETLYFIPQIETKIMNEGWASFWHYNILKELDLPQGLHLEFLKRHNDVVAPIEGGLNPYYLGFKMFEDIERRYGREKLFEVRSLERDSSFIKRYLTKEICEELKLFKYNKRGYDNVVEEVSDDFGWRKIRDRLSLESGISSVPYIRVIDLNLKDNALSLEHVFDGRELELNYAKETLKYVYELWGGKTILFSKNLRGDNIKISCEEGKVIKVDSISNKITS